MEEILEVYRRTLVPLSLFEDPTSEEDKSAQKVYLQRPVTPIDDEIKRAPTVFSTLADYVRRRVKTDSEGLQYLDSSEQDGLAAVLVSEVRYLWPEFRMLPQNPFLSAQQNRELRRRIAVFIVTTCQILFRHYIRKLEVLNGRGVFNTAANVVRLKAQLADDAHRFLNIQTIRRHILEDIRNWQPDADQVSDDESVFSLTFVEEAQPDLDIKPRLSFMDFLNASRPQIYSNKKPCTVAEEGILAMISEMPNLDIGRFSKTSNSFLPLKEETVSPSVMPGEMKTDSGDKVNDVITSKTETKFDQRSLEKPKLRRIKSLTELPLESTILAEFEDCDVCREDNSKMWHGCSVNCIEQSFSSDSITNSKQFMKDDLQKLAACENVVTSDDDIPPLIQFLHSNSRHEFSRERLEKQLKALEEREKMRKEKETLNLQRNLQAQPSFITKQMSATVHVRTSDVRISNRVSLSPMRLQKYDTVYNHLSGEIDVETWKKLDANLFLKEEMTDVFEEIMKTMPSDHLLPESDICVEPGPDDNEVTSFTSTHFAKKPKNRIINPNLKAGFRFSGQNGFSGDNLNQNRDKNCTDEQAMHDLLSKSVGSWLTWWKNTINSDDYMKYLSTQETDYLGVLFQFYNSDDEENEERIEYEKRILENEQKVNALVLEKVKYEPGLWNVNSVLLGGLGQRPVVDSPRENVNYEADDVAARAKSSSFIQTKANHNSPKSCQSNLKPIHTADRSEKSSLSNVQERLESIWALLQMPESMKLDMTIKYSFDAHYQKLDEALDDWEMAADLISERENVLAQLEKFERSASNPARLLCRATRASKQLKETSKREGYNHKISAIDFRLKELLFRMDKVYQDVVTYQGRPYIDKMEADRTEMLFWLQEERKKQMVEYESRSKHLPSVPPSLVMLHPLL